MILQDDAAVAALRVRWAGVIELARRRARKRRTMIILAVAVAAATGWAAGSKPTGPHPGAGSSVSFGRGVPALRLRPGQALEVHAISVDRMDWPTDRPAAGGGFLGGRGPTRGFVSYARAMSLETAYDGTGVTTMEAAGPPTFMGSAADRSLWQRDYRQHRAVWNAGVTGHFPSRITYRGLWFGSRRVTYRQLLGLPRDGRALRRQIRSVCARSGADPITVADMLLTETALPADERAGIIHAALGFRGARIEHAVRDPLGRLGDSLTTVGDPRATPEFGTRPVVGRLIYDPRTYAVLAEGGFLVGHSGMEGIPPNVGLSWRAYTSATLTAAARIR